MTWSMAAGGTMIYYYTLLWERPTRRPQVAIAMCCNILHSMARAHI